MQLTGYRGYRGRRTFSGRSTAVLAALSLFVLLAGRPADCRRRSVTPTDPKRKHHWKLNVIKNHLKNHKSLEGMTRLVDGKSEHEGEQFRILFNYRFSLVKINCIMSCANGANYLNYCMYSYNI